MSGYVHPNEAKFTTAFEVLDQALLIDQGKQEGSLKLPDILFSNNMLPDDFHHAYHDQELARQVVVREALNLKPNGEVYRLFKSLIDLLASTTRYNAETLSGSMFYGITK